MSVGLLGKKIGMTREFMDTGQSVPVTVIKIEKGRVIDIISKDKRGYNAVKFGFFKNKKFKINKTNERLFCKKNTEPKRILKEFRVEKNNNQYKEGNELGLEIFKDKKFFDVKSKTIGKGFAGVMKRWNFGGLISHGVSVSHRSHGSTGQRQDPGKVFKGKKWQDIWEIKPEQYLT